MPSLEQLEKLDFSVASRSRQVLCLSLAFIFTSILFSRIGESHMVWGIAVSLIAMQVGVSTLWSP